MVLNRSGLHPGVFGFSVLILMVVEKSKKIILLATLLSVSLFSTLFLASFRSDYLGEPTQSPYLSEIVCRGDTIQKCDDSGTPRERVFTKNFPDNALILDQGSFISEKFGKFLHFFISNNDDIAKIVLKIMLVKSLLATYFLLFITIIYLKYNEMRNSIARLTLVLYCLPFFLISIATFYPPGLTSVAFASALCSFHALETFYESRNLIHKILLINFGFSLLVIFSSRIETTFFVILYILVTMVHSLIQVRFRIRESFKLKFHVFIIFCLGISFGASLMIRTRVGHESVVLLNVIPVLTSNFYIYPESLLNSSWSHTAIGDLGFAISALPNMALHIIDLGEHKGLAISKFLSYAIFLGALFFLLNNILSTITSIKKRNKIAGEEVVQELKGFFFIVLFFAMPVYLQFSWTPWYVMPLFVSYVFATNYKRQSIKIFRWLILLFTIFHISNFWSGVFMLGDTYVLGQVVDPLSLSLLFTTALLSTIFFLSRFLQLLGEMPKDQE